MLGFLIFLVYVGFLLPVLIPLVKAFVVVCVNSEEFDWGKWNWWKRRIWFSVLGIAALTVILGLLRLYTEVWWFQELGYTSRLWKAIGWRWGLLLGFGIGAWVFIKLNTLIARKLAPSIPEGYEPNSIVDWKINTLGINVTLAIGLAIIGIAMGFSARANWMKILMYANQVVSGITEPIFSKDVSFYLFSLPFFKFLSGWSLILLTLTLAVTGGLYWFYYDRTDALMSKDDFLNDVHNALAKKGMVHGAIIMIAIIGILIWRTVLSMWNLLYSSRGVVFGASYTDVHAQLPVYRIYVFVLAVVALILLISAFRKQWKLSLWTIGGWFVAWLIIVGIYPKCVQYFSVRPNELDRETEYIMHNIRMTREAYGITGCEERNFEAKADLTPKMIGRNQLTLNNIRLWDWRALQTTFKQIQELRLYYEFGEVDIDRYIIGSEYRQVMLSPRELTIEQLPERSKTWINERFKYTHGYGLCLNVVNEFSPEGWPNLVVKDVPPKSTAPELEVTRPEIYFGEMTNTPVFVNTTTEEFDHPSGDENVYCTYQGAGGVQIAGLKKLPLALKFDGHKILLSRYLTPESKIMFRRNIEERVKMIAPFLILDKDPYVVIDDQGKLWWIQDAYTVSNSYPYSERFEDYPRKNESINYVRNSVKVVIDAYNGSVSFFVFDESDPIVQTYRNIFPGLFRSRDKMPADLQKHIRYPEDFLSVQALMYAIYHMQDPQVFYNKEDLWEIAQEIYIDNPQSVLPYYVIMRLPGEKHEEFIQMVPFTPTKKNNMIGWMAGRCDGENYGKLLVYKFPKQELVYGPMQIENRIDQNTEISEKLTLWGQKGSQVIRGNLLVIPIENSLIYVEPIYLVAEEGGLPQLKKVIVACGDKLEWGDTFEDALSRLLTMEISKEVSEPAVGEVVPTSTLKQLARRASNHYNRYLKLTGQGKLQDAARELEALKRTLEEIKKRSE